jgi:hypothetical protein
VSAHYLVVEPWESDAEDLIQVEHPSNCPAIVTHAGDGEHPDVVEPNCAVGFYIGEYGVGEYFTHADDPDGLGGGEPVKVGRHEIEAWHVVHPAGPWGATEYDAGVRLVDQDPVR